MPRGDRRGPEGWGARTGRGLGYCNGYDQPGFMHPAPPRGGRGMGNGRRWGGRGAGYGHGWGYGPGPYATPSAYAYPPPYSEEQERAALAGQVEGLERQLEAMRRRLEELGEDE